VRNVNLAFLTNESEKRKSAKPGEIQVKNRRKAISVEKKIGVVGRLENR
jgi:hypothetical protein